MKKITLILGIGLSAFTSISYANFSTIKIESNKVIEKELTIKISGMTCGGCASTISSTLEKIEGVIKEDVNFPGDKNTITYDASKTSEETIIKEIEELGYTVEKL